MIAFYMDENVHGAIIKGLRQNEIDALRVQDDGMMGYPDEAVLARATALNRILFSQDEDLLREAMSCQQESKHFSGVIYAHQLDLSIGQCVRDLTFFAQAGTAEDFANQVYYLPL